ncbi:phosphatase PAP2 family protein [Timonella sp. A28]|uniref:phosphatase PAP2 family protein n=1 Tax=Timonella sp. A28 TaxID=3442640 RepID=UPI003EB6966E
MNHQRQTRNTIAVRTLAFACAALAVFGVYVLWRFFVATEQGQHIEEAALSGSLYGKTKLWTIAEPILDGVSIAYVGLSLIAVVAISLLRKRWVLAVQVVTVIVGANITTQILKKFVFDRPDFDVAWGPTNTLPSGHTTVAAATSLALLLAVPRKWRPFVAVLGAGYTAAMGVSTLVGQWHRPSDVYAAILVAAAWAAFVSAFSTNSAHDPKSHSTTTWTVTTCIMLTLVTIMCALTAFWFLRDAFMYWDTAVIAESKTEKNAYIGSVFAVGAISAIVFGATLAIRQSVTRTH